MTLDLDAARCRDIWCSVVLQAMTEYASEQRRMGTGADSMRRWANSKDGRTVLLLAGIDHSNAIVTALVSFVEKGVATSQALTQKNMGLSSR